MDFNKIQAIKSSIEEFTGAKFYSLVDDKNILIENAATKAIYKIGFTEDEDKNFIFDTTGAKIIKDKEEIESNNPISEFKENCNTLVDGIKNIFSEDFDNSLLNLKEIIRTLPVVDKTAVMEEIEEIEEKNQEEANAEWIEKVFAEQIEKYKNEEKTFARSFNIFDEDGDIIEGKFMEMSRTKELLRDAAIALDEYKERTSKFGEFKSQIAEAIGNEKFVDTFLENFAKDQDPRIAITKKLVSLNNFHEANLNIVDTTKKLVAIFENNPTAPIGGERAPVVYNLAADNKFTPKFFRFHMGIFTPQDVKTMLEEINFFVASYDAMNEEDQLYLFGLKHQLEYMYHSGQINDHIIMEMLKEFGKKYAKDKSDEYQNAAMQLAWKTKEQMKEGNVQGIAIGGATV